MTLVESVLPYAYLVEVVQFALAALALFFEVWMVRDTRYEYVRVLRAHDVPPSWIWQGKGNVVTELWRAILAAQLVGIGWYLMTHQTGYLSVQRDFLDWRANTNIWRVLLVTLTASELASGITSRWFRRKADRADGIEKRQPLG